MIGNYGGRDARDYSDRCDGGVGGGCWRGRRGAGGGGAECGGADTVAGGCFAGAAEDFACAYGDSGGGRTFDIVLPGMDSWGTHAGRADYSGGGNEVQRRREDHFLAARFGRNVFDSCGRAGGRELAG